MITTITLKKADIIQALKTEPLKPGAFITASDCTVCAVGAALRSAMVSDDIIGAYADDMCVGQYTAADRNPKQLMKEGNYLGALSVLFERYGRSRHCGNTTVVAPGARIRDKLIAFVTAHFPESFQVSYGTMRKPH